MPPSLAVFSERPSMCKEGSDVQEGSTVVGAVRLQLVHHVLELLDAHHRLLKLMSHQLPIEVHRKDDEHHGHRDEDDGGCQGSIPAVVVEDDPGEDGYLRHEQQDAEDRREGPGCLDVQVHLLVGRLRDRGDAMHTRYGFKIWQDACRDHQGKHVHGHEQRGAHAERYQQLGWDALAQLDFYHRHLARGTPTNHGKSGEQRGSPAGRLQLGSAEVQSPPRQSSDGVLRLTHLFDQGLDHQLLHDIRTVADRVSPEYFGAGGYIHREPLG
ncbi:unnamed protein product [Ixodes persulcatus]